MSFSYSSFTQERSFSEFFALASQSFALNDYHAATEYFRDLDFYFSEEDLFSDTVFQCSFLSMYGMSSLLIGDHEMALGLLNEWFKNHYSAARKDALLLVGLIQSRRFCGQREELLPLYRRFIGDFPSFESIAILRYEKLLVHLQMEDEIEALNELGEIDKLVGIADIQSCSRLAVIDHMLSRERIEEASNLLLRRKWSVCEMPELAVLAKSAMKIAQYHVERNDDQKALDAYQFVPFYALLVEQQQKKLLQLESLINVDKNCADAASELLRTSHYNQLLLRMKADFDALLEMSDYSAWFMLEYGSCYLRMGRFSEAWAVFRALAYDDRLNELDQEKAHYLLVMSCYSARRFEEAMKLCHTFLDCYPSSQLIPHTMFLLSRAYSDIGELEEANRVLTELIDHFEGHSETGLWMLSRGSNWYSLGRNDDAIFDFSWVEEHSTGDSLRIKAKFWRSMALKDEGLVSDAIRLLQELCEEFPEHWMYADFRHRLATYYYAKKDYKQTRAILESFLKNNTEHPRVLESQILLGDTLMALGSMEVAISVFESIELNQGALGEYAYFQLGKIYRALEDYASMQHHFEGYLQSFAEIGGDRFAEALYWLGWCLEKKGCAGETIDLYLNALRKYGNEKQFSEVQTLLSALSRLLNVQKLCVSDFDDFDSWFNCELERVENEQSLTYLGRLKLYEATRMRQQGDFDLGDVAVLDIGARIPSSEFDDMLLGEVGAAYCEAGFSAGVSLLEKLICEYPQSLHRGFAFYGLALVEKKQGNFGKALQLIRRFEKGTPGHSMIVKAQLIKGECLSELNEHDKAVDVYNEVLRLKQGRGEPHIECLVGLAQLYERKGEYRLAIPYWQRIYTLYRGYSSYVATSYLESAQLFEKIGMFDEARKTYQELLAQADLQIFPEYELARARLKELHMVVDEPFEEVA